MKLSLEVTILLAGIFIAVAILFSQGIYVCNGEGVLIMNKFTGKVFIQKPIDLRRDWIFKTVKAWS